MPSREQAGSDLSRPNSDQDGQYDLDPDTAYAPLPTDLSAVVKQEFSFRNKPRDNYIVEQRLESDSDGDLIPSVTLGPIDRAGDGDYAPKSRVGAKKKRPTKPKKKKIETAQVSEDESVNADMQAYFDKKAPRVDEDGNDLFCICRRGDLGKWMIGCDGCDEWYHGECIEVSKAEEGLIDQYFCPRCQRDGAGTTVWKRKCRLKECRKPALDVPLPFIQQEDIVMSGTSETQTHSKYCSVDHGVEYFRRQVSQALVTKSHIKSMLLAASHVDEFRKIGDVAPSIEGEVSKRDAQRLAVMSEERERIYTELARLDKRSQCLKLMHDRATRVNAAIKARKEKEVCGLDERLNLQDEDLDTLLQSEEFTQSLLGSTTEKLCIVPAKKCVRHAGWFSIKLDGFNLEETLLRQRLAKLRAADQEIRLAAQRYSIT